MNDYNPNIDEALEEELDEVDDNRRIGTRVLKFTALIVLGTILTTTPAYWAWTTRGNLEGAAIREHTSSPIKYKKTLMTFNSLGYKLELVRITNGKEANMEEFAKRKQIIEEQEKKYIEKFSLKAKAIEKENQKIQTHVQNEKETKDKELIKTLGEKLELAPEEQADLTAILVGE